MTQIANISTQFQLNIEDESNILHYTLYTQIKKKYNLIVVFEKCMYFMRYALGYTSQIFHTYFNMSCQCILWSMNHNAAYLASLDFSSRYASCMSILCLCSCMYGILRISSNNCEFCLYLSFVPSINSRSAGKCLIATLKTKIEKKHFH